MYIRIPQQPHNCHASTIALSGARMWNQPLLHQSLPKPWAPQLSNWGGSSLIEAWDSNGFDLYRLKKKQTSHCWCILWSIHSFFEPFQNLSNSHHCYNIVPQLLTRKTHVPKNLLLKLSASSKTSLGFHCKRSNNAVIQSALVAVRMCASQFLCSTQMSPRCQPQPAQSRDARPQHLCESKHGLPVLFNYCCWPCSFHVIIASTSKC